MLYLCQYNIGIMDYLSQHRHHGSPIEICGLQCGGLLLNSRMNIWGVSEKKKLYKLSHT